MDTRLAYTWRMTVNEKNFIKNALQSEIRIDDRKPYEYRKITIKFGMDDGSKEAEVQVSQTRVMSIVIAQLVQPCKDRPNEGSLSVFTDFSPMVDPSFEPGRPTEYVVELGRIIDRGLRNLVDAANIAALAALMTFRRPECSLGGDDGQQVIVHPQEIRTSSS